MRDIVFWSLFLAVMLGIVLTLAGNYRRARERELELEALHAKLLAETQARRSVAAAPAATSSAAEVPGQPAAAPSAAPASGIVGDANAKAAVPAAEEFDPGRTRLFVRGDGASAATGTLALIALSGRSMGTHYPIPAVGLAIGRADDNDVIIIDGRVSAHHAWIGRVNGQPMLRDYQSLNGTFLNEKFDVAVSEAALGSGDTIRFGGTGGDSYRFVIE